MPRKSKKYNERIEIGRTPDGKRIRKWIRADSKAELEALRRQAYRKAETNASDISFGRYALKWYDTYKANRSIQTQEMYKNAISKMDAVRDKRIAAVTSTDLQQIINWNWSHARTCEVLKLTMKQICKQAIRDKLISNGNPAECLEIPKKVEKQIRIISDDEMKQILLCPFKDQDRRYVDVLRNTGMRPSEALALDWRDIDFDDNVIHVRRSFEYEASNLPRIKPTKTNRDRDIPMNSCLRSVLLPVRQEKGYVFTKEDGEPFTKSAYTKMSNRIFKLITEAIGENNLVMYSFRHTFATFLYYHGCRSGLISTKKAAQTLGHSEKVFLDRYTHIDDSKEQITEILEKLS